MDIRFRQDVEAIKDYVATMADAFTRIADALERLVPKKKMTNLDWIRTLNAKELADWFYDEWIDRMQYKWSSSRRGLEHWLTEERVDTPQTDCDKCIWSVCNYNKVDWDADTPQTDRQRLEGKRWTDALTTEEKKCMLDALDLTDTPQTDSEISKNALRSDCTGCRFVGTYDTEFPCANCTRKNKDYYDAEQTDCPVAIVFGCDECHRPKCDYKNCRRCKWFATDKCHECFGNELFEDSGYVTQTDSGWKQGE